MENVPTAFKFEQSPMREAYDLLGAKTPLELSQKYSEQDQVLFKTGEWDYENPELVINKIKNILEKIDEATLTEEEVEWRQEILWFWYHHAISCALSRYKDREKAREFSAHALKIQPENHPNKITKLLDLLVNDKLEESEEFVVTITDEPEKGTAEFLIEEYKKGNI